MRVIAVLLALVLTACSSGADAASPYATEDAKIGDSQAILGWNVSVTNLRFDGDYVLVDVDAAPSQSGGPHARADALRFGLYGALSHPIEANAVTSCTDVTSLDIHPASAPVPDKLSGTVCLGPLRDQSQVRGVYVYSADDRIAKTTVAYPASFPVGLPPTNENDTGLVLKTTTIDAFRADGGEIDPTALGDPAAFNGNGYMLMGLEITGAAQRYNDDSVKRGGPLMIIVGPTLPGMGLSHACSVYGASLLVLPEESQDAVSVKASLCTQGTMNAALLYPTVSVVGTHAALWTKA